MRARLFREWLLVALLALALVGALVGMRLTTRADNLLYDLLAGMRPPLPSAVTIVAIDDLSLARLGRWPWPRDLHARLLARLAAARPAAIGYDVLFVEPSPQDAQLARALIADGGVTLPMTFVVPGLDGAPFAPELPTPMLRGAGRLGHALLLPDGDGIVRRVSLLAGDREQAWPAFAEAIHRRAHGTPSAPFVRSVTGALPRGGFGLSSALLIPTTQGGHPTVSFASVLAGEVPPELLRGRVLLVGSTAAGSGDRQPVSGGTAPGVEITADILDALAANRTVTPVGAWAVFGYSILPLGLLLGALLRLPPRANLLLGVAMLAMLLVVSGILLLALDLWLPPAAAMAGVALLHPLWGWRRLAVASAYMMRELRRLQAEPDPLPASAQAVLPGPAWLDDPIDRQRGLLEGAVARVRDLRRFFSESLQNLPDATIVVDPTGRLLVANRAAELLFDVGGGTEPRRVISQLIASRFLPAARPSLGDAADVELATPDGRTYILRSKPLIASGGAPVGAIMSFIDLTALRLATRQREEAMRLLSHDMRAPQAAILALTEQGCDVPAHGRIAGYARRTMKLADEFVLLTRAEVAALAPEILNIPSLLVEAADELWPVARRKAIRVDTPQEADEHLVLGDRSLLLRLFINLLDNAIRYGPEGSTIRCTLAREGPLHVCRIEDRGPGIAEEALEAIFRPFDRAGRKDREGTGLGLAFVRTVATRHGGGATASNAAEGGAVLTVRLPAVYDPPALVP